MMEILSAKSISPKERFIPAVALVALRFFLFIFEIILKAWRKTET